MKKLLVGLLIVFALFKTFEAHQYKKKCGALTSHVLELAEKRLDSIFIEKTFVSLPIIN